MFDFKDNQLKHVKIQNGFINSQPKIIILQWNYLKQLSKDNSSIIHYGL